jgi:hypothetical protein
MSEYGGQRLLFIYSHYRIEGDLRVLRWAEGGGVLYI